MRVRLGLYEIDLKAGELHCGDGTTVLQSQPHKILLMLVERPGEIVTRDEIQRQLWPDGTIVNYEVSINQAISKLRHALNDSAANPKFVETVGRRGYRLKVPVTVVRESNKVTAVSRATALDHDLLELCISGIQAGYGRAERKVLAAVLQQLLQMLAYVGTSLRESPPELKPTT